MKKIIVSVTNDLVSDQRVHKVCQTLVKMEFNVLLVGRKKKNSLPINPRNYSTLRLKLFFEKGFLFYAEYNIHLFFFLLFRKVDVLIANDLDTLLPNFLISKIKQKKLVYDSHEYFCFVPELMDRPLIQRVWKTIEKFLFPKLKFVMTVNNSIADLYKKEYKVNVAVVRNVPLTQKFQTYKIKEFKQKLGFSEEQKIIIYQGAVNKDRGLEEAVLAMQFTDKNIVLLIVGDGDILNDLKNLCNENKLNERVQFIPKVNFDELKNYTAIADIGISLEKNTNLNYRYSLPNKLFDYIHSEIPVLAAPLEEIKIVFNKFEVGLLIENHNPKHIAEKINEMLANQEKHSVWKENTKLAAIEYCWEKEEEKLKKIYNKI